jgi:hypothetical protein
MSTPINDATVLSRAKRISDQSGSKGTRLRGRRLIFARVAWIAMVSLIVGSFFARLPAFYTALQTVCTGTACGSAQPTLDNALALQKLGLSVDAYAAFILVLTLALAFLCFTVGAVIFWRRSDDWLALLVALAVVATVTLNENVYGMDMNSVWGWPAMVLYAFGTSMYLLVGSLTLDGRFVTRWARWLLLCWPVAVFIWFIFMGSFNYTLAWLAAFVLLLIAQVYHYRTAASPLQRQQGKWLLFGLCVAVIIAVGLTLLPFILLSLGQAGSFYRLVATPAYIIIELIYPLCLALAILRYRLWDIDIIVRRTLIYSTLTVVLAVIYEVSVFTLQSLFSSLTFIRGNQLALVASTFLIGGLFKPLHDRTKALIDRRFYRRKYDAARTVAAFSATIRDEVDLNQLCAKLTTVVQETMQPSHVSLWLCPPKRYLEDKTTQALPYIETVSEP